MSTTSHLSLVSLDFPVKLMRLVYSKCDMILVYAYIILLGLTGKSQRTWGKSQSIFISIIKHNVVSWQDPWFPWYLRFRHLSKGRRHQDVAGLGMGMIWRISFFLYDQMMKQENIWKCTHVLMDFFFFNCVCHINCIMMIIAFIIASSFCPYRNGSTRSSISSRLGIIRPEGCSAGEHLQ